MQLEQKHMAIDPFTSPDYYEIDQLLSAEQKLVRDATRTWTKKEVSPIIEEACQKAEFPKQLIKGLADIGAFGPCIPQKYGGAGLDQISYGLIMQEIERGFKKIKQGILAWAVQGFKGWADHGWTIPSSVRKETQGYRVEMDPLTHWMEDCCELVPTDSEHGFATFASLWDIYEDWLKKQTQPVRNMRIETKKAFGIQLQKRGLEAQTKFLNNKTQRVYKGIQLV